MDTPAPAGPGSAVQAFRLTVKVALAARRGGFPGARSALPRNADPALVRRVAVLAASLLAVMLDDDEMTALEVFSHAGYGGPVAPSIAEQARVVSLMDKWGDRPVCLPR